jgi:hypothetical protein
MASASPSNLHFESRKVLTREQSDLLKVGVERYAPNLLPLTFGDVVALPLAERNQLRSALGNLLTAVGFDASWSITKVGQEIEDLIDILGPK